MECPYCGGFLAMLDKANQSVVSDNRQRIPPKSKKLKPPFEIICQSCGQTWQESEGK